MTDSIIRDFVRNQRELLELELNSEQEDEAASTNRTSNKEDSQRTVALRPLEASDISVGLYGRTVVQLTLMRPVGGAVPSTSALLPAHRFTVGDDVEIHSKQIKKGNAQGGVISAVTDTSISVALFQKNASSSSNSNNNKPSNSDEAEEESLVGVPPLKLIPKSSVEVHRKLVAGLAELEKHGPNHPIAGPLVQALFLAPTDNQLQTRQKLSSTSSTQQPLQQFNENLDNSQLEAISFALEKDRPVALIHGPPGTGKTTVVAELIQQAVHHHNMKVLVTAPSNVAVDNVLERLAASSAAPTTKKKIKQQSAAKKKPLNLVRLGHPARIKASILRYSLEALVQSHDGTEIVQDVRQELQSFLRILTNPKSRGNDKRLAYREVKSLRKEVRTREEKVVKELISSAQVVLATTVGAASKLLKSVTDDKGFDLIIIDEAAQALEASCWIPILKGRKLVLAGDHCQLPPTIMSKHSKVQAGLGKTLFERLMKLYGDDGKNRKQHKQPQEKLSDNSAAHPRVSRMLKVQYRMHEDISNWASEATYHGELMTHESVRHRTIGQLVTQQQQDDHHASAGGEDDVVSDVALLLVDTAGCAMHEMESASGSRFNEGEAQVVVQHVKNLLDKGVRQEQIAIITPYNGQVELLRTMLLTDYPKLEIRSVDGFQGGEREAVVLSLVRSSERTGGKKSESGIGFLRDNRRLNVAVTRAKRHCAVICDSETTSQSNFIKGLITWMEEHGEQRSAIDFMSGSNDMISDLRDADIELRKAMAELAKTEGQKKPPPKPNQTDSEAKRKQLLDKISKFSETEKEGQEMTLSSELSSFDRRVVHEFAEQIGLGHRSEGDGDARRIILRIEKAVVALPSPAMEQKESEETIEASATTQREENPVPASAFAALAMDDDSSESENDPSESHQIPDGTSKTKNEEVATGSNNLLSSLAREREQRAKEQKLAQAPSATPSGGNKKENKKKKGQKLGGKSKPKQIAADEGQDDLDDMAFLDKQIEKVQTSHGRKVAGTGNSYKTVINGILLAKPKPQEKPKDARASAALQSKLKKAQTDRQAKTKKKKK